MILKDLTDVAWGTEYRIYASDLREHSYMSVNQIPDELFQRKVKRVEVLNYELYVTLECDNLLWGL